MRKDRDPLEYGLLYVRGYHVYQHVWNPFVAKLPLLWQIRYTTLVYGKTRELMQPSDSGRKLRFVSSTGMDCAQRPRFVYMHVHLR